jgi:hypothetical protein
MDEMIVRALDNTEQSSDRVRWVIRRRSGCSASLVPQSERFATLQVQHVLDDRADR